MQAGKLDRRITVQRNTPTVDGAGGEIAGWADLCTVWASKQDVRDVERAQAAAIGASITTRFQVRWSSITSTIDVEDRILFDGRAYDVKATKEIGRREGVEITAAARAERLG